MRYGASVRGFKNLNCRFVPDRERSRRDRLSAKQRDREVKIFSRRMGQIERRSIRIDFHALYSKIRFLASQLSVWA